MINSGLPATFAGGANYQRIFTDNQFLPALAHTAGFTVVSVTIETVLGLGLALVLNRKFPGRGLVRAAIFIPWAVPTVVSAQLWKSMFDPQNGWVNYVLTALHLPLAHTTWLAEKWTAWAAILAADAWRNTPFIAIVLLAGLQVIPGDIYEAARIDGANAWQTFLTADASAAATSADGCVDLPDSFVFPDLRRRLCDDRRRARDIYQRAVLPELAGVLRLLRLRVWRGDFRRAGRDRADDRGRLRARLQVRAGAVRRRR